ncbi:MAG: DUF6183 family protein [Acidimicrobiales bacterium]
MDLDELIELGDLDELVREVDRRVSASDWDGLLRLRDRCRAAVERGKQLWPVASLAEYRLALDAPGRWAAAVIVDGAGRFALGPLPEVAASTHRWEELAAHLAGGPLAAAVAHERAVRGEDLRHDRRVPAGVFDPVPLALQAWEPEYAVATYEDDATHFPMPPLPPARAVDVPASRASRVPDADGVGALVQLAYAWVSGSNGRCEALAVAGRAVDAVAALGVPRLRMAELSPPDALALMAWTAASGGAHGRRRGMAAGRFDAWWAAATLAGLGPDWTADELREAVGELRWYVWDAAEPDTGWWFRLAVEDSADGLAWAVSASDAA